MRNRSSQQTWPMLPAAMLLGCLAGCNSTAGQVTGINRALLTSPVVTIDAVSVNGTLPPKEAWDRALNRFASYLSGRLVVKPAREITVPVDANGRLTGSEDIETGGSGPDYILVILLPKAPDIMRGRYTKYARGLQVIRYDAEGVGKYDALLPRERAWEIVLFHELGHAIGVPSDPSHADASGHCTNPSCVMYPRPDICSILTFIARGWPLDFCDACKSEIDAARNAIPNASSPAPNKASTRPGD